MDEPICILVADDFIFKIPGKIVFVPFLDNRRLVINDPVTFGLTIIRTPYIIHSSDSRETNIVWNHLSEHKCILTVERTRVSRTKWKIHRIEGAVRAVFHTTHGVNVRITVPEISLDTRSEF